MGKSPKTLQEKIVFVCFCYNFFFKEVIFFSPWLMRRNIIGSFSWSSRRAACPQWRTSAARSEERYMNLSHNGRATSWPSFCYSPSWMWLERIFILCSPFVFVFFLLFKPLLTCCWVLLSVDTHPADPALSSWDPPLFWQWSFPLRHDIFERLPGLQLGCLSMMAQPPPFAEWKALSTGMCDVHDVHVVHQGEWLAGPDDFINKIKIN